MDLDLSVRDVERLENTSFATAFLSTAEAAPDAVANTPLCAGGGESQYVCTGPNCSWFCGGSMIDCISMTCVLDCHVHVTKTFLEVQGPGGVRPVAVDLSLLDDARLG